MTTLREAPCIAGDTELLPGVYAFPDPGQLSRDPWSPDECALTVLATVGSHTRQIGERCG